MKILSERSSGVCVHALRTGRVQRMNEFQVRFRQRGSQSVAYCRGRLVYGASDEALRFAILWNATLLADFKHVESIDAAGLGMLAQLHVLAMVMGTTIGYCHLNKNIRNLLRTTHLDSVLHIVDDEDADAMCGQRVVEHAV